MCCRMSTKYPNVANHEPNRKKTIQRNLEPLNINPSPARAPNISQTTPTHSIISPPYSSNNFTTHFTYTNPEPSPPSPLSSTHPNFTFLRSCPNHCSHGFHFQFPINHCPCSRPCKHPEHRDSALPPPRQINTIDLASCKYCSTFVPLPAAT